MIGYRHLLLVIPTVILWSVLCSCEGGGNTEIAAERNKKLAGELRDNKLYRAAIEEYEQLLRMSELEDAERANVCYLMGKVYFEDLGDYSNAAACFVRARALDPNGSFMPELSKSLVASFQKMGRIVDASRQMAAVTDIDTTAPRSGDEIVAKVGGEPIWRSEVEEQIQTLPADLQQRLINPSARAEYLHQYVGIEVLYRAAMREGYDGNQQIQRQQRMLHKKLLVDQYVLDKVMPQVRVDTADVRNFYLAHKDQAYRGAPYDSVRAQVFLDYQTEKAEAAFSEYVARLAEAEKVEFFDDRMR
jgi:tetratricopeptide (TPR) repeat protein